MVRYLRLSVTDRCNLRCAYCRSEINQKFIPHPKVLRYEEMVRLVGMMASLANDRLRWVSAGVAGAAGVVAFALPLKLNIVVAIAVAVAVCLLLEQRPGLPRSITPTPPAETPPLTGDAP